MTEILSSPLARPSSKESLADIAVLANHTYFASLKHDLAQTHADDRVAITSMGFDPTEPLVADILSQVYKAGDRKVNIGLGIDAFALLEVNTHGPLVFTKGIGKNPTVQQRLAALDEIGSRETAHYSIINMPPPPVANILAGRSHMKLAVFNDHAYLGGPSLQGTHRLDMVARINDTNTADWLYQLASEIIDSGSTTPVLGRSDFEYPVDSITDILVDTGKPGQSHILEEALQIIDDAEEYLTVSFQYFPTGEIGKRLVKAIKRGVEVNIAYNHPSQHDRMRLAHYALHAKERLQKPSSFFRNQVPVTKPPLHAKVIANEDIGIVGSHNFVAAGVKLGTPEIAVRRKSSYFAQNIRNLLQEMTGLQRDNH